MTNAKIFMGGLPTEYDVRKLEERFGVPNEGVTIPYEEISECIGIERHLGRWHSIVRAWRNKLRREHNLITDAEDNVGIKILTPSERVSFSNRKQQGSFKQARRCALIAASTRREGLTAQEIRLLDHVQNLGAAVALQAATAKRQLCYEQPKDK